jgi:NitT/TauT family transport system substrate-binding protein
MTNAAAGIPHGARKRGGVAARRTHAVGLAALGVTFPITLLGRADAAIEQPCRAATPVHLRAGRGHPVSQGEYHQENVGQEHQGGIGAMPKILALSLALLGALLAESNAPDLLEVAVAQRGFWNSTFIDVGLKQGFFKEAGLDIEILYTEGGASTLTPVIAGSIEIAMTNGTLGVIAAYTKGMPVKIISAEATGAPDAFWYARPESGIKSLSDTAGKTVAFSSPGSSTNLILLQLMQQAKASAKLVPTGGAPGTLTQVMSGQIDVGWSVPPFVLQQLADGKLAIIAKGSDVAAIANQTIRVNVANTNALKEKRDAFVRFVRVLSRSIDWAYSDPRAIDNYAEIAKVPRPLAQRTRDEFYPKESLQLAEVKGLDMTLKQALEFKYITTPMSVADAQGMLDILYQPPN